MTWFLQALVLSEEVVHVFCSEVKPDRNCIEIDGPHTLVHAEVLGEYRDASEVFPIVKFESGQLIGLTFINQTVEEV